LFFSCFLYFLKPLILATYTFIIAIISFSISSSGSNFSGSLIIVIFPFEYLVIISSINSKPNLVNLSLWATTNSFDSKNRNINNRELKLDVEPLRHHFIIIKNFWRAGKRMNDTNVGIVYEYNEKKDINITAQGLIARFCGNDKQYNNESSPYLFGNIDTLKEYIEFMKNNCDFKIADYMSQKLVVSDGEIIKHKPSVIDSIKTGQDTNELYSKKDYIDVPRMIVIEDELYKKISVDNNRISHNAEQIIIDYLKNNDIDNLYKYVSEYKKIQITIPEAGDNYKKHIIGVERCISTNKPYKSMIGKKDEFSNAWVAYVDKFSRPKKIYFLIYHGKKYFEFKNKNIINV
jgi:hypothetical protein